MPIPHLCISVLTVAQSTPARSPVPAFIWIGVLIAILAVGGSIWVMFRRQLLENEPAAGVSGSLMEHLRNAHARGEISDAEYEQTRKAMASRVSQQLDTKRAGGLFELPDPKRRPARPSSLPNPGRIMPPDPHTPLPRPSGGTPAQVPPGYDLTGDPLPSPPEPE
jgi:hypothetical protein